ncbi:hypothetical protein [Kitasatospora sp. NPDC005751]|uniref:hypothetical protein n=1 Tax=Kitasatospora sp. NPDC005751 TaxID=3157064 RepID=UPI0033CCB8EA
MSPERPGTAQATVLTVLPLALLLALLVWALPLTARHHRPAQPPRPAPSAPTAAPTRP